MREILFRGKRIDNGEWVYGGCVFTENKVCLIYNQTHSIDLQGLTVDRNTVGQYTGLTDKNGKKIFEGDIVRLPNNPIDNYSIDIVCDIGGVVIHNHRDMGLDTDFSIWYGCELEIIGNIHDNPELLEEKI